MKIIEGTAMVVTFTLSYLIAEFSQFSRSLLCVETCDFEFGLNKEKCYWTQDTKDDFDWKREHSGLVLYDVRPNTDHTLRKHYGKLFLHW